jgi:hypothetical protein
MDNFHFTDPVPSSAGAPIPEIPTYPTFDNLDRWVGELNSTNRARIRQVISEYVEE